ncbi:GntR family transcriptional regulator [Liquorilactobacillus satsumensis]|uniref:GntR family transcriptional regulator n=1 Tax=Liquorilactobacillus TaxID=2767888 RepID=UPI0021C330B7|nr:GntR family transcriptional regulator [Liquorilactobacillus satsumensis]MCP9313731.1 GntR family transcriptional regulator [Liquorilactobacillus satsumensis]MCP9360872.1 GntR family transcriptional regulator [Liquorilactobacillus satsumensis]
MEKRGSLYSQVMEKLRKKILTGEYQVNSKLPSELELMKIFNVSRVTLRKAIEGLVNDGIVEKVQGIGTFVRKPKKVKRIILSSAVESFSKIAIEEGFEPTTKIIDIKELLVSQNLAELLETKKALFIKRVRFLDNDPVMLENNYFPLPRFKKLANYDLTESLYSLLHKDFGIVKLISKDTSVNVTLAKKNEADLLKKSIGYPLFLLKPIVKDENDKIVQIGKEFIIYDRYEFNI